MRPYFNKLTDKYIPYLFNMMFIIIARQLNAFNVMKKKYFGNFRAKQQRLYFNL